MLKVHERLELELGITLALLVIRVFDQLKTTAHRLTSIRRLGLQFETHSQEFLHCKFELEMGKCSYAQ